MNLRSIQGVGLQSNIILPIPDGSITELRHVAGFYDSGEYPIPIVVTLRVGGPVYTTVSSYLNGRIYRNLATPRILSESEINTIFGFI